VGVIEMSKECLWYDGVQGCYHLLDFDPNGLEDCFGFYCEDLEKAIETMYLIDVEEGEEG
jgi:hypothetical protein